MEVPRVLTIAGSDSGGGAGVQADIKTFVARDVYGASVITALTAQNTLGVQSIHLAPIDIVRQQLESVFNDIGFGVVKTGMLPTAEAVEVVVDMLQKFKVDTVVVDPVLVATSGDELAGKGVLEAVKTKLVPLATVLTPNVPEAEKLIGWEITDMESARKACRQLINMGCKAVLLKGGHQLRCEKAFTGVMATDVYYDGKEFQALAKPRLDSPNTHGTGCTMASTIAAEMAKGKSAAEAVVIAKGFVHNGIAHGHSIGRGHGPVNQMKNWTSED